MKPVVGIFAHPDDEVFGPGGTLAKFAQKGRDVYLICVTDGDAGMNTSKKKGLLGNIRREELKASAKQLGITRVYFLGYKDGTLSNNLYHEIAEKITAFLERIKPDILLTMEPRGVSGHLDHIAVSMITSFVFEKSLFVQELRYLCLTKTAREVFKKYFPEYFIYMPPGYPLEQVEKIVDISSVWEQKLRALQQHTSQQHDMEKLLQIFLQLPKQEHFLLLKK